MRVLYVNNVDLDGRRFNGYDLLVELRRYGISAKQAVLSKMSDNPDVFRLLRNSTDETLHQALAKVEKRRSMNNILFPWGRALAGMPEFYEADVVHLHLLHNQVVSLLDLPMLTETKPSVWTFHDPWPVTGHCAYPADCKGWLTGCKPCPHLDWVFPIEKDCADRMWRLKGRVYAQMDVDIVVASQYMLDIVKASPLTRHFERVHLIPFGIDTAAYLPGSERAASRRALGIPEGDFVILFRSSPYDVKGLRFIIEALGSRRPERSTTLVTLDRRHLIKDLTSDYNVVEMGWVQDPRAHAAVFSACDVFLMPSTAEAFGLMALEAMAAGRPVISFEGTAVPWVTSAPECGIAVPMGDSSALRAAIDSLAESPEDARRRGQLGRQIANDRFKHEQYLDSVANLYRAVLDRGASG